MKLQESQRGGVRLNHTDRLQIHVWTINLAADGACSSTDYIYFLLPVSLSCLSPFLLSRAIFYSCVPLITSHIFTKTDLSAYWCRQYVEMKEYMMVALGVAMETHSPSPLNHSMFLWDSWTGSSQTRKGNIMLFHLHNIENYNFFI